MAETATIVKHLQFEKDGAKYAINATQFEGHTWSEVNEIKQELENIASFDALRYMGTLAAGATLPAADKGDVYKVTSNGTIAGATVEIGDMLICSVDGTAANTPANWDIIQANIDIAAILDHTHDVTITPVTGSKELDHTVTLDTEDITATFTNGTASVNGGHNHTASGSVTLTPQGSVNGTSVTPKGTVTLTTPATKGTNDATITSKGTVEESTTAYVTGVSVADHAAHNHTVSGGVTIKTGTGTANYTPAGTVNNSSDAVTNVTIGDLTVSVDAEATSVSAGTPSGSVTVDNASAGGTVASHNHTVTLSPSTKSQTVLTGITATADGDTLVITHSNNSISYLDGVSVASVSSVAPEFTATPHNHTASFRGNALAAHTHEITVDEQTLTPSIEVTKAAHTHGFTGTGVNLVATHNITTNDAAAMEHTVTAPTSTHAHGFTGGSTYVHAAFAGTAESHSHDFTGTEQTNAVTVTVDNHTGNFSGSASGNVNVVNGTDVVKGVTIGKHKFDTMVGANATTGSGEQN